MKFSALLLDIEGTVTSISFVKDVLFPYAFDNVESYVRTHFNDASVAKIISTLRQVSEEESKIDSNVRLIRNEENDCIDDVAHNVRYWIRSDKKITAMKELQGMIWEEAYRKEHVKGHVYPDVFPILQSLTVPIYIYSSGSVFAQKLLFGHTIVGDMTKILSGYFDTTIGYKGESDSYRKICESISLSPSQVLFLTDVESEARAASIAGLQVKLVIRDGNAPLSPEAIRDFVTIHSLEEIL
uniref:Enolase-phosphatase E1 n=1 Tax=Haemonchus contortus TaxID=6289 RepID=A0A7I5EB38_HAECO